MYGIFQSRPQFQSTLPRRERLSIFTPFRSRHLISIHAPAKGATIRRSLQCERSGYFNPRSREGSDQGGYTNGSFHKNFNPRSREGSDVCRENPLESFFHFNPRSREGSDGISRFYSVSHLYFNPRSREGSDDITDRVISPNQVFQSTLPRRERLFKHFSDPFIF